MFDLGSVTNGAVFNFAGGSDGTALSDSGLAFQYRTRVDHRVRADCDIGFYIG
ncbi:hypothetical protein D3C73_1358260 [compost metagenome]